MPIAIVVCILGVIVFIGWAAIEGGNVQEDSRTDIILQECLLANGRMTKINGVKGCFLLRPVEEEKIKDGGIFGASKEAMCSRILNATWKDVDRWNYCYYYELIPDDQLLETHIKQPGGSDEIQQ
jgi:hypothetical protein